MKNFGHLLLVLGVAVFQAAATRITLDDDAKKLCHKYAMMCKQGKVCAVQHFDWPQNITLPVCIPLSFVPVRNVYCQLPPDTGRCHARYIRWYFNSIAQECSHFQYGGCEGNQNNFMSKKDCEQTCMATPAIRLYDNGHSALVQPAIVSAPIYDPPAKPYDSLVSVLEPASTYDRYQVTRHRSNRDRSKDETNNRTRRRLDKEKEKEKERKRKDREKRREKKRLRRLRKLEKELNKQRKREQKIKEQKEKKRKPNEHDVLNGTMRDDENALIKRDNKNKNTNEVIKDISSELESEREKRRRERRKERKRLKRRERRKRLLEKERKRLERLAAEAKVNDNDNDNDDTVKDREQVEPVRKPDAAVSAKMFASLDQGKDSKSQKNNGEKST